MNISRKTAVLVAAVLMLSAVFVSCGPEALGIYPTYVGEEVSSTYHEFKKEDFFVLAAFDDGSDEFVTDFEIGEIVREGGEYIIEIKYGDISYPVSVPINVSVYPSENNGAE